MPPSALRFGAVRSVMAVFLLAAPLSSTLACTVLSDLDRVQCETDNDCTQRGGAFAGSICRSKVCVTDPMWSCLGKVTWPEPTEGGKVTARFVLSDLISGAPITDATVHVCGKLDPECKSPLSTESQNTADGILAVPLERHFDGFVEITSPAFLSPTLYFFYPPVDEDRLIPYVPLVPFASVFTLGMQLGRDIKSDRGLAIAIGYDCTGKTAAGMSFGLDDTDDTTFPFFMQKGLPNVSTDQTDSDGQGGFANVKPGIHRMTGTLLESGKKVGAASVVVRAPFITYTTLVPTPD